MQTLIHNIYIILTKIHFLDKNLTLFNLYISISNIQNTLHPKLNFQLQKMWIYFVHISILVTNGISEESLIILHGL